MKRTKVSFIAMIFVLAAVMLLPVSSVRGVLASDALSSEEVQRLLEENARLRAENASMQTQEPTPTPDPTPRPVGPAKLQLISTDVINIVNGTFKDVELTVKNIGSATATSIFNTAVPNPDAPIQVQFLPTSVNTSSIAGNTEQKLILHITADANAKEGVYPITLAFQYKDKNDLLIMDTGILNVKVVSTLTPPEILIADFAASESAFYAGTSFKLTAQLSNIGGTDAKNIQLTVEGMSSETIYMSNTSNTYQYSTVIPGQRMQIEFEFLVSAKAKPGTNLLTFKAAYKDKDNKDIESSFLYYATVSASVIAESKAAVEIINLTSPEHDVAPGEDFIISMDVVNNGKNTARNIKITSAADADGAIVPRSSSMTVINALEIGATQRIEFAFAPTAKAKNQNYALSFKAEYETGALDSSDKPEKLSFEQYTGVNVIIQSENTKAAALRIASVDGPTRSFGVGENFNVSLILENIGEYPAKNIKISSAADADGAIVPMSTNSLNVAELGIGEATALQFTFAPTQKAKTRNYAIEFKVEYDVGTKDSTGNANRDSFEQYFGVNVIHEEPEATPIPSETRLSRPKIIIESYDTDPIIVKAGQEFDLHMLFKNTHETKTITNIKAELRPNETTTTKGSVFIPVQGSTTFYIDRIPPLEIAEKTFRMYTIPDADPRNYTITVTFKYQDEEFYDHEESETIGIMVKQTTRVSTGNYSIPEQGYIDTPIYLYFSIMNTGKAPLNNLTVTIEGNFDVTKSFNYFGTVNKSSSAYYDGEFTPNEEGVQEGKIVMTFEDETGEETRVERDFVIEVIDMSAQMGMMEEAFMHDMPIMQEPQKAVPDIIIDFIKENAVKPVVWAGTAAVIIIILVIRGVIKRKKRVRFDE